MKVLSICDGISVALQALKEENIKVDKYVAYEIDKHAIAVAKHNHPEIIHRGNLENFELEEFDLVVAGFPCTSFSRAGLKQGFNDARGQLAFKVFDIFAQVKPKWFLFENVASMSQTAQETISELVGVKPLKINSSDFVAQNRARLYWTNLPYEPTYPETILTFYDITGAYPCGYVGGKGYVELRPRKKSDVSGALTCTALTDSVCTKQFDNNVRFDENREFWRYLTGNERDVLQGLPKGYTSVLTERQRRKATGNSFTCSVIRQFVKSLKSNINQAL